MLSILIKQEIGGQHSLRYKTARCLKQLPQALKLESGIEVLLILVAIMVAYKLWILPLHESLWMDETIGYWTIQGGLWEIFPRTALWIAQSVLHHLIAWSFVTAAGQWNEVIFRLPSVIAVVIASFLLYDLGVHLLNRRAALYAAVMFITFDLVAFAATNGRPYGLALLAIVSALLFLVRWLKFGRARDWVGYSLTASATIHLHYLFATMFLIHILYAALVLKNTEGFKAFRRQLAYAVLLITVSLLPLLPKALKLLERGHELAYAPPPTAVGLIVFFLPLVLLHIGIPWGFLLNAAQWPRAWLHPLPVNQQSRSLLLGWTFMHPCVLAIIALTTSYSIFFEHYLIPYIPALALLLGWRISQIDSKETQKILIFAILLATLLQNQLPMLKTTNPHRLENWRSAARRINEVLLQEPSALVILRSGFVESDYRSLSAQEDALFTPNLVYPLATTNIIRLPRQLNPQTEEYLATIGTPTLTSHDRIIFLGKRLNFPKEYVPFLASLLHPAGFTLTEENFGTVQLATFKRNHTRISDIKIASPP